MRMRGWRAAVQGLTPLATSGRPSGALGTVVYVAYATPGMMKMESHCGSSWRRRRGSGPRSLDYWSREPAEQSDLDVAPYPVLLPPTVGEHVEQTVSHCDVLRGPPPEECALDTV